MPAKRDFILSAVGGKGQEGYNGGNGQAGMNGVDGTKATREVDATVRLLANPQNFSAV